MIKLICIFLMMCSCVTPVSALEIEAPTVPEFSKHIMPEEIDSFGDGLVELLNNALNTFSPDLVEAFEVAMQIITVSMMLALLQTIPSRVKHMADITGTAVITSMLLRSTKSMISLATQTIQELSNYGKLLCPVMTTALAAQGGISASTSLYIGTSTFNAFIGSLIADVLVPMVYLFLALSAANSAVGEDILKKLGVLIKNAISWSLKTLLMVFTTYMSITGVVSGTTDKATLKATKVVISSAVPVVGGILSDASESILVGAELMKNAAGIYGILATLAVFVDPFLKIGVRYILLKITSTICGLVTTKSITGLIEDFTTAFGLLLAMTGSVCLLLLISTVCFLKGVS